MIQVAVCPVCGAGNARFLWAKGDARYDECPSCGLVYENPRLDEGELQALYSSEGYYRGGGTAIAPTGYSDYFAQVSPALIGEYMTIIERASGRRGGRHLDVGSGPGMLVAHAISRGWDAIGQEISHWACERAREQGIPVLEGPLGEHGLPSDSFDAISMFDVLEHLPEPHPVVRETLRMLKPGGVLVIETPNIGGFFARRIYRERSELVKPRSHICLYNTRAARTLLKGAGFRTVEVAAFPYCRRITAGYLKSLVASRLRPGAAPVQLTLNDSLRIVCTK